jgi:hypothetical protein
MDVKRKTEGFDPKLIGQLISGLVAWALARFFPGVELPPEAEVAIAAVVGAVVGYLSPAPKTEVVKDTLPPVDGPGA